MKPPGKTTLYRMQLAAHNEAARIEISQDGWVKIGTLKEPMPDQVLLRDDFAGIVRLLDVIQSDKVIMDRLEERAGRAKEAAAAVAGSQKVASGDEEVDAE